MKNIELVQGNYYWVLENYDLPLKVNKSIFDKLILCTLAYRTVEYDIEKYYFRTRKGSTYISVLDIYISKTVYDSIDDFIVYLVKRINSINFNKFEVDNYVINKIKESQEKYPEKWI